MIILVKNATLKGVNVMPGTRLNRSQLDSFVATDDELDDAINAHVANNNPHTQYVRTMVSTGIISGTYQATVFERVLLNSAVAGFTVSLPINPIDQDRIDFIDVDGSCNVNPVIVWSSSHTVEQDPAGLSINISGASVSLMFFQIINTWKIINNN